MSSPVLDIQNYTFDTCLCGGLCVKTEAGRQDKDKVEVYSLLRAYSKRFQLAEAVVVVVLIVVVVVVVIVVGIGVWT
jgi:hypothetical protein